MLLSFPNIDAKLEELSRSRISLSTSISSVHLGIRHSLFTLFLDLRASRQAGLFPLLVLCYPTTGVLSTTQVPSSTPQRFHSENTNVFRPDYAAEIQWNRRFHSENTSYVFFDLHATLHYEGGICKRNNHLDLCLRETWAGNHMTIVNNTPVRLENSSIYSNDSLN